MGMELGMKKNQQGYCRTVSISEMPIPLIHCIHLQSFAKRNTESSMDMHRYPSRLLSYLPTPFSHSPALFAISVAFFSIPSSPATASKS